MGAIFGGGKDNGAAARVAEQEKAAKLKEQQQALQLQARRTAMGGGSGSKTIFSAVEGIGAATEKKTKLGA